MKLILKRKTKSFGFTSEQGGVSEPNKNFGGTLANLNPSSIKAVVNNGAGKPSLGGGIGKMASAVLPNLNK